MLTSGVGFLLLGMLIDIKIISKYDYTPISFTVIFLLGGVILGVLLVFRFLHRK
jgi:ABC-type transport system involved in cytochrome c biogenesis permease subunit